MKFPLFLPNDQNISLKRIFLYCLYYSMITYIISIFYSMNDPEFEFKYVLDYIFFDFVVVYFTMCLMVTMLTLPLTSIATDRMITDNFYYRLTTILIASTINSLLYLTVYYFVWSSGDYPLDLFRAIRIASPFYLAAFVCMIL